MTSAAKAARIFGILTAALKALRHPKSGCSKGETAIGWLLFADFEEDPMRILRPLLCFILLSAFSLFAHASKQKDRTLPPRSDVWKQLAELTASDGQAGDRLGYSVSKSDNTVVIGAPDATIGSNAKQGAAYVFVEGTNGWSNMTQTAKLTASDGQAGDRFGISAYVCHNVVVVGMEPTSRGSKAYVFVEPAEGWKDMTETAQLTASESLPGDHFGSAVSVSLNTIVVGDFKTPNSSCGAAYVYSRPVGGWKDMTETQAHGFQWPSR